MDVPSTTISARSVLALASQLLVKATWVHGRRAVVEPARLLPAAELEERVCQYFGCQSQDHLIAQQAA